MQRPERRWSDVNYHWGPFTWSPEPTTGHGVGVMLDSGGRHDGEAYCCVRFYLGKRTLIAELPNWVLRPKSERREFTHWSSEAQRAAYIERTGRDHYFETFAREIGFNVADGQTLHIHWGAQTHAWPGSASKCFFLPWSNWRFIRHTHYTPDGKRRRTFWDADRRRMQRRAKRHGEDMFFGDEFDYASSLPTVDFQFKDYDGEEIIARTRVDEREWRLGTGLFAWLSLFVPAKIARSIDIQFSAETGRRKGSWKGGTIGHSCEMKTGESIEDTFRRYCGEHQMTFIGLIEPTPPQDGAMMARVAE
jgi:hypothetical protein